MARLGRGIWAAEVGRFRASIARSPGGHEQAPPLVLLLTWSPGYHYWVAYAAMLPGIYVLVQEVSLWLRSQCEPVRVRAFALMREARLRDGPWHR